MKRILFLSTLTLAFSLPHLVPKLRLGTDCRAGAATTSPKPAPTALSADDLKHLINSSFGDKPILPRHSEIAAVQQLFSETLSPDANLTQLQVKWGKWEMQLAATSLNREPVWLLSEEPSTARGRGLYIFRNHRYNPLFLQAPHSRFDKRTLEIAASLFADGPFRAAAWNTVHRSQLDVAHTEATYFQAFTAAIARIPGSLVAQVHGFDQQSRDSHAGTQSDLILSSGSEQPPAWFTSAGREFARHLPGYRVRLFPFDVQELGATTNVQAKLFHHNPDAAFLHLECSQPLRAQLETDATLRAALIAALEKIQQLTSPADKPPARRASEGRR